MLLAVKVVDKLQIILERQVTIRTVESRAAPSLAHCCAGGHEACLADVGCNIQYCIETSQIFASLSLANSSKACFHLIHSDVRSQIIPIDREKDSGRLQKLISTDAIAMYQ